MTEVMVNGPDDLYVERLGRLERAPHGLFEGEEAVRHLMGWVGRGPGGGRFVDSGPGHRPPARSWAPWLGQRAACHCVNLGLGLPPLWLTREVESLQAA